MLDAISGPETGGAFIIAPPERAYLSELERDPEPLRIAFSTRSPLGTPVDPEVVEATERSARLLEQLGHSVEQIEPGIDQAQLARDFLSIWYAQLAHMMREIRVDHSAPSRDFELDSLAMEAVARGRSALDYADCYARWTQYGYELGVFFTRFDLYMTPTLAQQPPRIGAVSTPPTAAAVSKALMPLGLSRLIALGPKVVEQVAISNLAVTPYTQLANVTGVPAMSVPLYAFANGLPLGIQFAATHGAEGLLLSLAGQLERALPWRDHRPPLTTL